MSRYVKVRADSRRYKTTELMTVTITRPPRGDKLWRMISLAPDGFHSTNCEILDCQPKSFLTIPEHLRSLRARKEGR